MPEAERGSPLIKLHLDASRPDFAILAVSDTGKGFPAEGRQRLLEPYMTTREGGTGLGLPIVAKNSRGARRRHGASRQPGRPRRTGSDVDSKEAIGWGGSCRRRAAQGEPMSADILVIDDEADIRELVAGILEDEGHRTRTAEILRRGARRDRIASAPHLVFLDILAAGQPPRRPAGARARQGRSSRPAGRDDLGPRQHRDGGLGDQARRLRLHRKALQGGPPRPRRGAGARSLPA